MNPVLCIAATRQCGKDTLYGHLHTLNPLVTRFAFADRLKEDLAPFVLAHFGWDIWTCTAAQKEVLRPILIAYGCAQRAVDIDHWVKIVVNQIKCGWETNPSMLPCVTDLRFPSELACLCRELGGAVKVLALYRDGAPEPTDEEKKHYRQVAAGADHVLTWGNESTEQQLERARKVARWFSLNPLDTTP